MGGSDELRCLACRWTVERSIGYLMSLLTRTLIFCEGLFLSILAFREFSTPNYVQSRELAMHCFVRNLNIQPTAIFASKDSLLTNPPHHGTLIQNLPSSTRSAPILRLHLFQRFPFRNISQQATSIRQPSWWGTRHARRWWGRPRCRWCTRHP